MTQEESDRLEEAGEDWLLEHGYERGIWGNFFRNGTFVTFRKHSGWNATRRDEGKPIRGREDWQTPEGALSEIASIARKVDKRGMDAGNA